MKVLIKKFQIDMEVKSRGIEFEVRTPDNSQQIGDCYVTNTGLIWCKGKTDKANGIKISWTNLTEILESKAAKKAAIKAGKEAACA